jgi:hypothetical protein
LNHEEIVLSHMPLGEPVKVQLLVDKARGMSHAVKALVLLDLQARGRIEYNLHAKTVTLVK